MGNTYAAAYDNAGTRRWCTEHCAPVWVCAWEHDQEAADYAAERSQ